MVKASFLLIVISLNFVLGKWKREISDSEVECGISNITVAAAKRISFGSAVQSEEWPWMAGLYYGSILICGGTIVTDRLIVTAAHCIIDKDEKKPKEEKRMFFMVGRISLNSSDETDFELFPIHKIVTHPAWDPVLKAYDSDIAVAILQKTIKFRNNIKPICLPSEFESVQHNIKGFVAGWGATESSSFSNDLQIAELSTVDRGICVKKDVYFSHAMTVSTFCTELSDSGPCKGDSGGGYAQKVNDRWKLFGIVSFSSTTRCKNKHFIGYTDVSKYSRWIKQYIDLSSSIRYNFAPYSDENNCGQGEFSNNTHFPWVATMYRNENTVHCDGILVTKSAVISWGRCSKNTSPDSLYVILGDQNQRSSNSHKFYVDKFIDNDEYFSFVNNNGVVINSRTYLTIALLNRPVEYNMYVRPICMFGQPIKNIKFEKAVTLNMISNNDERVIGYESVDVSSQFERTVLEEVVIEYMPKNPVSLSPHGIYIKINGKWFIWGLFLHDIYTGNDNRRFNFVNLNEFYEWIQEKLLENNQLF